MSLRDQDIIELNELLDKLVENSLTLEQKKEAGVLVRGI